MNSSCYRVSVGRFFSFCLAIVCACALLVVGSVPALGQAATGTIVGVISDPSGAAVVNAEVKLTDPTTNSSQTTKTNEVGRYTFINVSPGTYDLAVSATGFTQSRITARS